MASIEVFDITYKEDKITNCIIVLNEINYSADWNNGEYIVKKISSRPDEEMMEEPMGLMGKGLMMSSKNKATATARAKAKEQIEVQNVQNNIADIITRTGRKSTPTKRQIESKQQTGFV
jgi:hypothetical protein